MSKTAVARKPKVEKKAEQKKTFIELLIEDHNHVKALFKKFEETEHNKEKKKLAQEIITELKIHTQIEEEVLYPAMRQLEEKAIDEMMNEADEEHHAAKVSMHEIENYGSVDGHFEAKVKVLGEMIEHHVGEEEGPGGMFKKAHKIEDREDITNRLVSRKKELQHQFGVNSR